MFQKMLTHLRERVTTTLSHVELQTERRPEQIQPQERQAPMEARHAEPQQAVGGGGVPGVTAAPSSGVQVAERDPANPETWGRVSRNEPCPCGSGKKYKHCHGVLA
jgi:preprotein translocase subunit SecA